MSRLLLPGHLAADCEREARRAFPLETGGAFMGSRRGDDLVVEHLIGPGPGADHRQHAFRADAAHQWAEMARIHRATGGGSGFLGDWHTHPRCGHGRLSALDVKALDEILRDPRSRAEHVVSTILHGGRLRWRWTGHVASLRGMTLDIAPCSIQRFI